MSNEQPQRSFCSICGQYRSAEESDRCCLCALRKRRAERYADAQMVRRHLMKKKRLEGGSTRRRP